MSEVIELIIDIIAWLIGFIYRVFIWLYSSAVTLMKRIFKYLGGSISRGGYFNRKKLFVFGLPHSGKSTTTAALMKYLDTNDQYLLRRDPVNNPSGVRVLREWTQDLHSGSFPLRTEENQYTKVLLEYSNSADWSAQKKLTLYEIAGEDVAKFDPVHHDHKKIPQELLDYLSESTAIMIFASSNPDTTSEAEVIRDFLEFIIRKKIRKPILLILTKFDEVNHLYSDHVQAAKNIYPGAVKLLYGYERSSILPFSIGEVNDKKIIKDESATYIAKILTWIEGI